MGDKEMPSVDYIGESEGNSPNKKKSPFSFFKKKNRKDRFTTYRNFSGGNFTEI